MVNYKNNQKVKIVGNIAGHGFYIGELVTLKSPTAAFNRGGTTTAVAEGANGYRYIVRFTDISPLALSKKEISESIKEYEDYITNLKSKLKFIDEIGSEEFDEDEFKIYNALKVLDDKRGSRIEKVRTLKAIING